MSKYQEQQQFEDYLKETKKKKEIKELIENLKIAVEFLETRILFYM
jgi:arsenate reductase-like glutaredoxin family protein